MTDPIAQPKHPMNGVRAGQPKAEPWMIYLIRTQKGALYCGICKNLAQRLQQHQAGKGAKYLRGKGPLSLAWSQQLSDQRSALQVERRLKQCRKAQKEALIAGTESLNSLGLWPNPADNPADGTPESKLA